MIVVACLVAAVAALRGLWSPCGLSMLSSLNPVAERARGNRFWVTACWYVVGAAAGGLALGAACAVGAAAVGRAGFSPSVLWTAAAALAVGGVVSDTGVLGRSLPVHPRQLDERWLLRYRRWLYAVGYGVQIGAGFATYIMSAAIYLTAALAVLSGSWRGAMLVGAVFGTVRGLTILTSAVTRTPDMMRSMHRRLVSWERGSLALAVAAQAGAAVWAAALVGRAAVAATGAALAAITFHLLRTYLLRTGSLPVGGPALRGDGHVAGRIWSRPAP